MAPKPLRLVRVMWEDASVIDDGPWVRIDSAESPTPTHFDQVGWLLELTPEHVILSSCVGVDLMGARDRIPTGMVRRIFEFAPGGGKPVSIPRRRGK